MQDLDASIQHLEAEVHHLQIQGLPAYGPRLQLASLRLQRFKAQRDELEEVREDWAATMRRLDREAA
jgi:hypothetical protein